MSISEHNLSIIIVTIKSDKIIDQCIKSIANKNIPIIVVENSSDVNFTANLKLKYKNIQCINSNENLGMGKGNNIGIKAAKTDYVFIMNPDVVLEDSALDELFTASKSIPEFYILSPISSNNKILNYGYFNQNNNINNNSEPFKVNWVDGCAMLLNKKKMNDEVYFDENFFMYLENTDMCIRAEKNGGSIFVVPKAKMIHQGANTVDPKYKNEIEFSRNWHWMWSKFYFNKKHFGFFKAFTQGALGCFFSFLKFLFYLCINNQVMKKIYFNRASGFYNALLGKPSWYRPNLKI
jgi:GT2 family glycosyltransferase